MEPHELRLRLDEPDFRLIEQAAALCGQPPDDFAVTLLVDESRRTLGLEGTTQLSDRDRDILLALLVEADRKPNEALTDAAERYKAYLAAGQGR